MSTFLPLNIRIDGKKILFVGGGGLAMHKLQAVLQFSTAVTVLDSACSDEVVSTGVQVLNKTYEPSDLDGFFLVYACTPDEGLNRRVLDDAQKKGVLCNIADNRNDSDFISPALFRHEGMTVSVSSDGRNARRSVEWRNAIKELFLSKRVPTKTNA
ncbi:bifunctional precorrin-2 dehydrogenase/sirohydrochlorin ferrochelatase [Chlorobium phaeovibrioides]|uniref:precorrin-2 dehydrogenase n=1 Tax=Chlorobium phaeovibrioides TaxID=1094 RepID=A0A5M8I862_CHLPH|nr:NAD(P)-dependent oxidoreductase [Chlorobium phaeovibrioides]KAA6231716.1 bifunctional precorrin-2 dehydrogenase/sirohydrochlorin ferrochelatase [Chlorobium phaeovibrioides]